MPFELILLLLKAISAVSDAISPGEVLKCYVPSKLTVPGTGDPGTAL